MAQKQAPETPLAQAGFPNAHDILMDAPIGIFTSTPEGRYLAANPALARMLGYESPKELIASTTETSTQVYADPKDRESFLRLLEKQGEVFNHECRLRRKDGTIFWVSRNTRAVRDNRGTITHYHGFTTDITARKQAEEALRASEDKHRRLFETMDQGVIYQAADGAIISANPAAEGILGLSFDQMRGKTSMDPRWKMIKEDGSSVPGSDHPAMIALRTGRSIGPVIRGLFDPDVSVYIWLSITAIPLFKPGEARPFQVYALFEDVTERKRAEEQLLESKERFRCLVEDAPYGLSLMRPDRTFEFINQQFTTMFGYTLEDIPDKDAWFTLAYPDPEYRKEVINTWTKDFGKNAVSGEIQPRVFKVRCKNGRDKEIHFRSVHLKDGSWIQAYEDITERKLAEEERERLQFQLLQAQKMESVGTLAGGVAHDFNNLLQAMRGNIELLTQDKSFDPRSAERLQTVIRSMDRAAQLVQQLLLFGRRAGSRRVRVDLNQEVKDVARMLERTIPRMIALELRLDPEVWPLFADPVQVEQILLNLANNAVDAMPEGGTLTVATSNVVLDEDFIRSHPGSTVGPYTLLTVTDTGHGMDAATLNHVFDPFFTTKEVGKGTGLGLASVYGIVKTHGGYIQCQSKPGRGATFRIYLPASYVNKAASVQSHPQAIPTGGEETVLVVDDEPEIRELTQEALEGLGYTVQCAASGEEALTAYREHGRDIDMVLLDLNMPGMGGSRCLEKLLRLDPLVKVVIASGYTANSQGKNAILSGAKGFISKPYRLGELATMVRNVLDT